MNIKKVLDELRKRHSSDLVKVVIFPNENLLREGIEIAMQLEKNSRNFDLINAMELGYTYCEKGFNIQKARIEFNKLIEVKTK